MSGGSSINPQLAFGKALRSFRLTAGLTQEQLSLESGVQRNFISLIETGQNQPTVSTIFRLAFALSIQPSRLMAEAEKNINRDPPKSCRPSL
jgi:transcriptional regulator with XRE-family HTH domain